MPHQIVEHEYELHMPVLPNPRPYWRFPNATEAYKNTSGGGQRLALSQQSTALSSVQSSHSDGGAHTDRVLTDDSGLTLLGSSVCINGERTVNYDTDQLKVRHTCFVCHLSLLAPRARQPRFQRALRVHNLRVVMVVSHSWPVTRCWHSAARGASRSG
jgi:hypothetical protein